MNGFMITILFLIQSKWRWFFFARSSTLPFPFELNLHSAVEVDIQTFLWKIDLFTLGLLKPGDLSNHNVIWKHNILKVICKWTNKIQGSINNL